MPDRPEEGAALVDVRLPRLPECWDTCGNCVSEAATVAEVRVAPGDVIGRDDTVIVLETDKTTLDIQAERAGRVAEVRVAVGDRVESGMAVLRLEAP